MSRTLIAYLMGAALLTTASAGARATTLRCSDGLVDEGDLSAEVLRKCGEPNDREVIGPALDNRGYPVRGSATIEHWVYGPHNGMYQYLRFIDGRLVEIRSKRDD